MKKERFLKSILSVFLGRSTSTALGLVASLLVMRWVIPEDMGIWNGVSVILVYVPFLRLGTTYGLARQLPFYMGVGEIDKARRLTATSLSWGLILGVGVMVFGISFSTLALFVWSTKGSAAILVASTIAAINLITSHFTTTYRSSNNFVMLGKLEATAAFIGFALLVVVWCLSFAGFLVRLFLIAVCMCVVLGWFSPVKTRPAWSRTSFFELTKIGLPLLLVNDIAAIIGTLDRVVLLSSPTLLGILTLALLVKRAIGNLVGVFSQVSFAYIARMHGEGKSNFDIWRFTTTIVIFALVLSIVLGVIGWNVLPPFVKFFLPKYIDGIQAAQWACLYSIAYSPGIVANILKVIGGLKWIYASYAIWLVVFGTAWFLFSSNQSGRDLVTMAIQAGLISVTSSSLFTFLVVRRHCLATSVVC